MDETESDDPLGPPQAQSTLQDIEIGNTTEIISETIEIEVHEGTTHVSEMVDDAESEGEITHVSESVDSNGQLDSSKIEVDRNDSYAILNDSSPPNTDNDPLSLANENQREMELMNEISTLQSELKTAQIKLSDLQKDIVHLNASKIIADNFLTVSTDVLLSENYRFLSDLRRRFGPNFMAQSNQIRPIRQTSKGKHKMFRISSQDTELGKGTK
jgi:hypothetical protein